MNNALDPKRSRIRELNDRLRQSFIGGAVLVTQGIQALGMPAQIAIVRLIRGFGDFDDANDPYAEHDFGAVEYDGTTIFFKIEYYDREMEAGSEDPSDPNQTTRVLTIMTAEEYRLWGLEVSAPLLPGQKPSGKTMRGERQTGHKFRTTPHKL